MYSIRSATLKDVDGISDVHVTCWRQCYPFLPDGLHSVRGGEVRRQQWRQKIGSNDASATLVLEDYGAIVGFAHITKNGDAAIPSAAAELHAAYFLPEYRGTCAGPRVMSQLLAEAEGLGWSTFCAWAWKDNPIRRTYRALGLEPMVRRSRDLCGFSVPEVGYYCSDIGELRRRLDRSAILLAQRDGDRRNRPHFRAHRLRSA